MDTSERLKERESIWIKYENLTLKEIRLKIVSNGIIAPTEELEDCVIKYHKLTK